MFSKMKGILRGRSSIPLFGDLFLGASFFTFFIAFYATFIARSSISFIFTLDGFFNTVPSQKILTSVVVKNRFLP